MSHEILGRVGRAWSHEYAEPTTMGGAVDWGRGGEEWIRGVVPEREQWGVHTACCRYDARPERVGVEDEDADQKRPTLKV